LSPDVREALYDESQGVIDVVLKLFMRAQTEAIDLGALKGKAELIDAKLIRRVARKNDMYMQKMLSALRDNDESKIALYDDLRAREKVKLPLAIPKHGKIEPSTVLRLFQAGGGNLDDLRALLDADTTRADPARPIKTQPRTTKRKGPAPDSLMALVASAGDLGTSPYAALQKANLIGLFD
jgi:hypothetical protein